MFGAVTLVFDLVGWLHASAVVALGDVNLRFVTGNFNVNFSFYAALITWFVVAAMGSRSVDAGLSLKIFHAIVQGIVGIGVTNR